MNRTFSDETLANICKKLEISKSEIQNPKSKIRNPIHVVYGGANLFKADTPQKLGAIALKSLQMNPPNFTEFAKAM